MSARILEALLGKGDLGEGVTARLDAPHVGLFRPSVTVGDGVIPGRELGRLVILGRSHRVLTPAGAVGQVLSVAPRDAVEYGQVLLELGAASSAAAALQAAEESDDSTDGYALKAPIDGIFYARPSPDAPNYVSIGDTVVQGATLGLVEVMKTFNPVALAGPGAPRSGVVTAILASDGDEVQGGAVLFRVSEV